MLCVVVLCGGVVVLIEFAFWFCIVVLYCFWFIHFIILDVICILLCGVMMFVYEVC